MSYHRTFLLDLNNDSTKYGLDLVCFFKNLSGQTVAEYSQSIIELERGVYQIYISDIADDFRGSLLVYANTGDSSSTSSSSEETLTYLAGFAINPEECEYVKAVYHCEIDYIVDDVAGVDRWTVAFFKNAVLLLNSEISDPSITVLDETGSFRIISGTLTALGGGLASNFWKYYASGAERGIAGENLTALAFATVNGKYVEFNRIHGRDS